MALSPKSEQQGDYGAKAVEGRQQPLGTVGQVQRRSLSTASSPVMPILSHEEESLKEPGGGVNQCQALCLTHRWNSQGGLPGGGGATAGQ